MSEEADLQKQVVAYLRAALKPWCGSVFVIANNRYSRRSPGFVPGCPDVCFIVRGHLYGLELKAKRGVPQSEQLLRHDEWRRAGAEVHIVRSLERVEEIIAGLVAGLAGGIAA